MSGNFTLKKLNQKGSTLSQVFWLLVAIVAIGISSLFIGMWLYWIDL